MIELPRALITGITGQDGSYLADLLIKKRYNVYGMIRRKAKQNFENIDHLMDNKSLELIDGDMLDQSSIYNIINTVRPHAIYNLAAQSFVPTSWTEPIFTSDCNSFGPLRILESIRQIDKKIKFYQASSSEMFGKVRETPQNELTPFHPRSPYGVSKAYAHHITVNYRESYDMFAVSGILFNHESPRRGHEFVTRKITDTVAKIKRGYQDVLYLGNLDAKRDWGFAGDYVEAMHKMLLQGIPTDYVISTGECHTVREFVQEAFKYVGLDYKKYVKIDPKFVRPAEVDILQGDSLKAECLLQWVPKTSFKDLVGMMVEHDLEVIK